MSLPHYLQLSLTTGLGPRLIGRLIEHTGSAQAACNATLTDLQHIEGMPQPKVHKIHTSLRAAAELAQDELARCTTLGITPICPDDAQYPMLLRSIPDPPVVLFMLGDLQPRDLNSFAIVGSRKCSLYGREQADRFAALLAGAGFTVISGGAAASTPPHTAAP